MKKLLTLLPIVFCCANVQAQNIEGQIIASQYGKWKVPGYAANTYSFAPDSCRVQGGASFFFAFTMGTPITIVDANPSLTETLAPTATLDSNVTCAVSIAPINNHQLPFYLTSATGGLQEAINQNLTTPETNTIILDNTFYQMVGGSSNAAAVIATAKGSTNLGLVDVTQVPTAWYRWNGSQYAAVGPPTNGGSTLVNDLFSNGPGNAWQDLDAFVATDPTLYNPQAALTAANAHNGTAILQPNSGRAPFANPGNVRVQDNRADVPATARGVTEFGAACDLRSVYGTLSSGSTIVTIVGGYSALFSSADIGRTLVAVGAVTGTPTAFATAIASITDSHHAVMATAAPFTQSTNHQMDLGHDDTAAITQGMNAVGAGGTLVFPEGNCLSQTQPLKGQSPIGLGPNSSITGFPGEDIFQAPDPSMTTGVNQGPAHIHDLTVFVDSRIDATRAWQLINDSGTTAKTAMYRPIAQKSGVSSNPLAPGWFQGPGANLSGAINGVAAIAAGSAVMCVPSAETAPAVGQEIVFPYLGSVFRATVASTAGSCAGGAAPRTLSATLPTGSTNPQAEWFAGSSAQNLATSIGSSSCPSTITLSNSINPAIGYESNVAPLGLVQIDGEQFSYFGHSNASNPSPANTLYNIQCAQNGTSRAAHASSATVVPLNPYQPSYPWPVVPTINSGDTTPAGTAGFFPGWNVGNAAFAFPVVNGQGGPWGTGGWSANTSIENLSFYPWPSDINGQQWGEVNHTAAFYMVQTSYATKFKNILVQHLFYGITEGPPSIENGNWANSAPTTDGSSWDQAAIWAANPANFALGNQNHFSNFNVYSQEVTTGGTGLGADTCFYFTGIWNDQTGGMNEALTLDEMHNLYCEPEAGAHAALMPHWEYDTYNSEIFDQHMGGAGEVYIGGGNQHWIGGNFNQSAGAPVVNWGSGNTSDGSSILGQEPKSNIYGTGALIDFGLQSKWSGQSAQAFGTPTGPYGAVGIGGREPLPNQTAETWLTGNLTAPYVSIAGGAIYPEEFPQSSSFDPSPMNIAWVKDLSSPITLGYVGCSVGNSGSTTYCSGSHFNDDEMPIGPGQRLAAGKYVFWMSNKDVTAATNSFTFLIGSTCTGTLGTYTVPVTNAWPTALAGFFTGSVDLTSASGCGLEIYYNGATTADTIETGFLSFVPVIEDMTVNILNATTINVPGGVTGGTPNGCAQSPVTGINNGYTCPTKGAGTTLASNQGISDTTISLSTATNFSSSGCFFVDAEYECYSAISGTTLTGVSRGAYTTTPASHSSGAPVIAVPLVLGSTQQAPSNVIVGGITSSTILSANNGFPNNHGGANVLEINGGANETWFDTGGAIHQLSASALNQFVGALLVGTEPNEPSIANSGQVLQTNGPNTAYSPITLGGGHAGSLNVTTTPTIAAPQVINYAGTGSTTYSYVCAGTDFDGNLINGTSASITNGPASYVYPAAIQVVCPFVAGVNTYQIYRTVGGPNQGLLASGTGPGFNLFDFYGSSSGGTPPASNASNPHISVAGSGNPTITLGTSGPQVLAAPGAPPSGCGSTYPNGSLYINTAGATGSTNLLYICNSATTAWVDIK